MGHQEWLLICNRRSAERVVTMNRHFGFSPSTGYSDREFKQGCRFNLFLGACIGIASTILTALTYGYATGLVW